MTEVGKLLEKLDSMGITPKFKKVSTGTYDAVVGDYILRVAKVSVTRTGRGGFPATDTGWGFIVLKSDGAPLNPNQRLEPGDGTKKQAIQTGLKYMRTLGLVQ